MSLRHVLRGRRRARLAVAVSAAGLLVGSAALFAAPSFAVHDTGQFELDGNVVNDGTRDWADLFNADGSRKETPDPVNGPLLGSVFTADSVTPDVSYFATSDKDTDAIGKWQCGGKNNPSNKNELLNAYAAQVLVPQGAKDNAGHKVLYLGSERDSNKGTSYAGFWLLQDPTVGCTNGAFSGQHVDGDILVVSDYTNGGGKQDVSVYRWSSALNTPVRLTNFDGSVCGGATADAVCAIANADSTIGTPWAPTSHDPQTFVEAGVDLTDVLANSGTCFSTFLAESRSSAELSAQLKDYALGSFDTCPPAPLSTTSVPGGTQVARGSAQHDVATLDAAAGRPLPTGTVTFFLCAPAQVTAAGCPTGAGTQVGDPVTVDNGLASSPEVSGRQTSTDGQYCWRAVYAPDEASADQYTGSEHTNASTECFTVVHADPTLSTQISVRGDEARSLGLTRLGDTATLTGSIVSVEGEDVTFSLYGPYTADQTPDCTGTPVHTETAALDANGVATLPDDSYTPTAAGTYVWVASYAGDAFNGPATEKPACDVATEGATLHAGLVGVVKVADPGGPVAAGDPIGFDITVSNSGDGTATGVTVHDALPAGPAGNLDWSLDPAYEGCAITGAVGAQVLDCSLGDVAPGDSPAPVHVVADTQQDDCGTISNTASVDSTNAGTSSDDASVEVQCAVLAITKTADAADVRAGAQIGFTIEVTNTSENDAVAVELTDPLPAGAGVVWSIDPAQDGCAIATAEGGAQTLTCDAQVLPAGGSASVHVVSATTAASCKTYDNVAEVDAQNAPVQQARASVEVICVEPTTAPPRTPTPSHGVDPQTLPNTGAGPVGAELGLAAVLVLLGSLLTLVSRRRRAH